MGTGRRVVEVNLSAAQSCGDNGNSACNSYKPQYSERSNWKLGNDQEGYKCIR